MSLLKLLLASSSGSVDPIALSIYGKVTEYWDLTEASGPRAGSRGVASMQLYSGSIGSSTGLRGGTDISANFTGAANNFLYASPSTPFSNSLAGWSHFGWIKANSTTGIKALIGNWNGTSASSLGSFTNINAGTISTQTYSGSTYLGATKSPFTDTASWHFFHAWLDPVDKKIRLQIDDDIYVSASSTIAVNAGSSVFSIGGSIGSSGWTMNGLMSRVGVVNGAILTPDEVSWLRNSGYGRNWSEIASAAGH